MNRSSGSRRRSRDSDGCGFAVRPKVRAAHSEDSCTARQLGDGEDVGSGRDYRSSPSGSHRSAPDVRRANSKMPPTHGLLGTAPESFRETGSSRQTWTFEVPTGLIGADFSPTPVPRVRSAIPFGRKASSDADVSPTTPGRSERTVRRGGSLNAETGGGVSMEPAGRSAIQPDRRSLTVSPETFVLWLARGTVESCPGASVGHGVTSVDCGRVTIVRRARTATRCSEAPGVSHTIRRPNRGRSAPSRQIATAGKCASASGATARASAGTNAMTTTPVRRGRASRSASWSSAPVFGGPTPGDSAEAAANPLLAPRAYGEPTGRDRTQCTSLTRFSPPC